MKKFSSLLVLLLILDISFALAQHPVNHCQNGDFESVSGFPNNPGQISNALGWLNPNGQTAWPYATPDLFHSSGSNGMQWPNTYAGTVVPQSGNSLSGLITYNFFYPDTREYIYYVLETPLVPGLAYNVSFWINNGSGNWYGGRGTNNLGIAFTSVQPSQIQREPIALVPQVEITSVVHHTTWVQYSFTFTPTQAYTYMTIGNFRNDAATSNTTFTSGNALAYYFLDNVAVQEANPLPVASLNLERQDEAEHMTLVWEDMAASGLESYQLERSLDQQSFMALEGSDLQGNPLGEQEYVDHSALPGVSYYYRLRRLAADGRLEFSPILEAKFGTNGGYVAGPVFPNPAPDHFSMDFATVDAGELKMTLVDAQGKVVLEMDEQMEEGQKRLRYSLPAGLADGMYFAKFQFAGQAFAKQVLVQSEI